MTLNGGRYQAWKDGPMTPEELQERLDLEVI